MRIVSIAGWHAPSPHRGKAVLSLGVANATVKPHRYLNDDRECQGLGVAAAASMSIGDSNSNVMIEVAHMSTPSTFDSEDISGAIVIMSILNAVRGEIAKASLT